MLKRTQFYLTLRRVANSVELAKIDPDTGLQEIVGPSLNKVVAVSIESNLSAGSLYVSYAQADARDHHITGEPIPDAPQLIFDHGLCEPAALSPARAGRVRVREGQAAGRWLHRCPGESISQCDFASVPRGSNLDWGELPHRERLHQATEVLALPNEQTPFERIVGVPLKSYVGLSWTYDVRH